jgi:hypothetical protein
VNVEEVRVDGFNACFRCLSGAFCIQLDCVALRVRTIGKLFESGPSTGARIYDRGGFRREVEETA